MRHIEYVNEVFLLLDRLDIMHIVSSLMFKFFITHMSLSRNINFIVFKYISLAEVEH